MTWTERERCCASEAASPQEIGRSLRSVNISLIISDTGKRKGASEFHCLDSYTFTCTCMHLDCKDNAVHYLDTCFTTGWSVIIAELCSARTARTKLTNDAVFFFSLKLRLIGDTHFRLLIIK